MAISQPENNKAIHLGNLGQEIGNPYSLLLNMQKVSTVSMMKLERQSLKLLMTLLQKQCKLCNKQTVLSLIGTISMSKL